MDGPDFEQVIHEHRIKGRVGTQMGQFFEDGFLFGFQGFVAVVEQVERLFNLIVILDNGLLDGLFRRGLGAGLMWHSRRVSGLLVRLYAECFHDGFFGVFHRAKTNIGVILRFFCSRFKLFRRLPGLTVSAGFQTHVINFFHGVIS